MGLIGNSTLGRRKGWGPGLAPIHHLHAGFIVSKAEGMGLIARPHDLEGLFQLGWFCERNRKDLNVLSITVHEKKVKQWFWWAFPPDCQLDRWPNCYSSHVPVGHVVASHRHGSVPQGLQSCRNELCTTAGADWCCRVLCRTALISWHQKVSSLCSEQKDAKYFFSHMVALSVALAFSHWTVTNGCLRSWGHASSLFLSWCQGSDYPSFSCSSIPLQHMVFSFSSQQNESWEGRKEFCRPAVQRTELLNAFSDSFSSPWQKCQQGGGSELHARKGRLPF